MRNHPSRELNMKRSVLIFSLGMALASACVDDSSAKPATAAAVTPSAALDGVGLTRLDGTPLDPATLGGKAVLVVNVASKCGYTGQYEGLQALYEAKKDQGLVILGVPSNQFGGQEPGSPEQIATFCKMNYGVTFPILEKQDVNGQGRSDLYDFLVDSAVGGGGNVSWNFEKFLVDRNGDVVGRFKSSVTPNSSQLSGAIDRALGS